MSPTDKSPGQVAYEAYCEKREWKSFNGETLPAWEKQLPEIAEAWDYAALILVQSVPRA